MQYDSSISACGTINYIVTDSLENPLGYVTIASQPTPLVIYVSSVDYVGKCGTSETLIVWGRY